jgi:hypothetical protein
MPCWVEDRTMYSIQFCPETTTRRLELRNQAPHNNPPSVHEEIADHGQCRLSREVPWGVAERVYPA